MRVETDTSPHHGRKLVRGSKIGDSRSVTSATVPKERNENLKVLVVINDVAIPMIRSSRPTYFVAPNNPDSVVIQSLIIFGARKYVMLSEFCFFASSSWNSSHENASKVEFREVRRRLCCTRRRQDILLNRAVFCPRGRDSIGGPLAFAAGGQGQKAKLSFFFSSPFYRSPAVAVLSGTWYSDLTQQLSNQSSNPTHFIEKDWFQNLSSNREDPLLT
jgi:hypothetical protein